MHWQTKLHATTFVHHAPKFASRVSVCVDSYAAHFLHLFVFLLF